MKDTIISCTIFVLFLRLLQAKGDGETSPSQSQLMTWAHTHAGDGPLIATNQEGIPMPSLTASLAVQPHGPVLLQDAFLLEKLASFNRERIPNRVVHAEGTGAFGYFEVTNDVTKYTKAKLFSDIGKRTNVSVRFSLCGGTSGSPEITQGRRGFAIKFYTEQGIYDLVGLAFETFQAKDPFLFPDVVRASGAINPATNLKDYNMFFDYISLRPEGTLVVLQIFSDRGAPNGYRVMDGYGVNTFKWVNATGHPLYVRYHWRANKAWSYLSTEEQAALLASNPDYYTKDLYDAIGRGDYPSWTLGVQLMTLEQARHHPTNPFDPTKYWPRGEYPLVEIGRLTLDRNPTDYFTQVEQATYSPGNMVPGIEPSPDRVLAGRIFAYADAQRYRVGINYAKLPVNKGVAPSSFTNYADSNYCRDGLMCYGDNGGGGPNYYPNSFGGPVVGDKRKVGECPFSVAGDVDRVDDDEDNFSQPREYINSLGAEERGRLVTRFANELAQADRVLQERVLTDVAFKISTEFGDALKTALMSSSA